MLPLVLLLTEVDAVTQEEYCKGNGVGAIGSGNGKVILTLLTEVIAFHVGLTIIDVRQSSLQWLLTGAIRGRSSGFEDCPEDLLQIFFFILSNRRFSKGIDWGMRSRQGRPRPQMEVILVMEVEQSWVDPKQRYSNGLADPLGVEQSKL